MKLFFKTGKQSVICIFIIGLILSSCQSEQAEDSESFYGTLAPFASEAVYFLMTDRFLDGDPSNNYPNQGGEHPTFELPLIAEDGRRAYVGYMGGDFKGILESASYIKDMGFTAIWLTPIVDQPDEAFTGDKPIKFGGAFKDGGKTGYHGYWGVNFFKVDEHLPSTDLSFKQLTTALLKKYQLKTVLDIVLNHGSPAFTMPVQQQFGQLFNQTGELIADHQNLQPEDLQADNPLHSFFNHKKDIMQLADFNADNPAVLDYFSEAYLHWIEQGASAFRIDTIKHMPNKFWKKFSDNIRAKYPDFFMFAESYSYDADFIGLHTQPENGSISVLDFPNQKTISSMFENSDSNYADLLENLYLENGPYANPYELMLFYDNHDMARMNTDQNGFIDAHNWLFTSRGIPVVYYGSEIGFMSGSKEHAGSRNYFGKENILSARNHPIKVALKKIANLRKTTPALQRGLQVNLDFDGDKVAFYRVYQHQGINQTALVLLNKGNKKTTFDIAKYLSNGHWKNAFTDETIFIEKGKHLKHIVGSHGVAVFILNEKNTDRALRAYLKNLMH